MQLAGAWSPHQQNTTAAVTADRVHTLDVSVTLCNDMCVMLCDISVMQMSQPDMLSTCDSQPCQCIRGFDHVRHLLATMQGMLQN